jgi:hypothetical protein
LPFPLRDKLRRDDERPVRTTCAFTMHIALPVGPAFVFDACEPLSEIGKVVFGNCALRRHSNQPLCREPAIVLPERRQPNGLALHCSVPHVRRALGNKQANPVIFLQYRKD